QSPPIAPRSMSVTLAFTAAAMYAVTSPALPPPMTIRLRSNFFGAAWLMLAPAPFDGFDDFSRDQWKHPEQHECPDESRRKYAAHGRDAGELRAGIHEDERAREHAELRYPVEGARRNRRERHHQIDDEEGERRDQPQREEVEGAVARNAVVDHLELVAVAPLDRVAQHEARDEEGKRSADGRGERAEHR